jgi:uncharacterized protein
MAAALLAGLIIFVAHAIAGATGFGSAVLALPLLALVVGLAPGKAALLILTTLLHLYIAARWWRKASRRELLTILIIAGLGLPLGIVLFEVLPRQASLITLGIFVTLVGLQGLIDRRVLLALPRPIAKIMLFLGGVVHGAFTTGGPLLVIYINQTVRDKSAFRSTLSVMWIALNIAVMIGWTIAGTWPRETLQISLMGLPALVAGIAVGEYVHHRLDSASFHVAVQIVLIATGLVLVLTPLR